MKKSLKTAAILCAGLASFVTFQNCSKNQLNQKQSELTAEDSGIVRSFSLKATNDVTSTSSEKFKIIWHIGPNSESIVQASETDRRLERLRSKVDGYYFLILNTNSLLTYWPERTLPCRMNYNNLNLFDERDSAGTPHSVRLEGVDYYSTYQEECKRDFSEYKARKYLEAKSLAGNPKKFPSLELFSAQQNEAALRKVLANLKIKDEQSAGKIIMSEMIIVDASGKVGGDFIYDPITDKITLMNLPKGYSFLQANGIHLDRAMTYQEPKIQFANGSLLRVPLKPGEDLSWFDGTRLCSFCLPQNLRMIGMLTDAFERADQRTPMMAINIRAWYPEHRNIKPLSNTNSFRQFGGINIEGSEKKMDKASYASSIEGARFILQQTDHPVSLLIPGSLDNDPAQTNKEANRDKYALENLISYVQDFNTELSTAMKLPVGQNAICNPRVSLIVGGYGAPLHMEPLPLFRRDSAGNLTNPAGTTGMQILVLSRFRERLCGERQPPVQPPSVEVPGYIQEIYQSCSQNNDCGGN